MDNPFLVKNPFLTIHFDGQKSNQVQSLFLHNIDDSKQSCKYENLWQKRCHWCTFKIMTPLVYKIPSFKYYLGEHKDDFHFFKHFFSLNTLLCERLISNGSYTNLEVVDSLNVASRSTSSTLLATGTSETVLETANSIDSGVCTDKTKSMSICNTSEIETECSNMQQPYIYQKMIATMQSTSCRPSKFSRKSGSVNVPIITHLYLNQQEYKQTQQIYNILREVIQVRYVEKIDI